MFDARPNLVSASGGGSTPTSKGGWADKTSAGGVARNYVLSSSISGPPRASLASRLRESLFSMERLQELRQETQAKMRPWAGDFFNREQFSMPEGLSMVQNRLSNNLRYYQSNYLITVLLIFCYCVYAVEHCGKAQLTVLTHVVSPIYFLPLLLLGWPLASSTSVPCPKTITRK